MPTTHESHLTLPEVSVLELTEHYGLTVIEAVARLPAFKRKSNADALRSINRLVRRRLLTETWLYPGRRCYCLTTKANGTGDTGDTLAGQAVNARPLSQESKIRRFAMLSFCCLGATPRTRLSPALLRHTFPTLDGTSLTGGYYLQPTNQNVIGFLRVDMGGDGRWDRVLAKCAEDARRLTNLPTWRDHLAAGCVEITVATAMPQKAERLSRALLKSSSLLPTRIAVIPEMLNLIAPPPY